MPAAVGLAQQLGAAPQVLGRKSQRLLGVQPPRYPVHVFEQKPPVPLVELTGEVSERAHPCDHGVVVADANAAGDEGLAAQVVGRQPADHAEVKEGDTAVGLEKVVAGMWIAQREPEVQGRAVEEAIHDLRVAVANRVGLAGDLVEGDSVDPVAHQHAPAAEIGVDRRYQNEGVLTPEPLQPPVVAGLELIVALLKDPLAQLPDHVLDLEPGHQLAQQR